MNQFEQKRMEDALANTFPEKPDIITLWNSTKKLLELVKAIERNEVAIVNTNRAKGSWSFTHNKWTPE